MASHQDELQNALILPSSSIWCNVVKTSQRNQMAKAPSVAKSVKAQSVAAIRASISFQPEVYETLETIAKEKKVSLAWVVRDAAEKYIAHRWPLLRGQE